MTAIFSLLFTYLSYLNASQYSIVIHHIYLYALYIRAACKIRRILIPLTYFTYLLTYFNYFRSSSSRARKKLKPKLELKKLDRNSPIHDTYFSSSWRKHPARWSQCEADDKANTRSALVNCSSYRTSAILALIRYTNTKKILKACCKITLHKFAHKTTKIQIVLQMRIQ